MLAVDTNVLVRVLARDDPKQAAAASKAATYLLLFSRPKEVVEEPAEALACC